MSKYSVSFVAGALLLQETTVIIPLLINEDEGAIQEEIETGKLTGINAKSSRKRKISEIRKRFNAVPIGVWESFQILDKSEQLVILYYVCLKTYQILQDFHIDIILNKWKRYDIQVSKSDFLNFLFQQADKHPEIFDWTELTHGKTASVALLMLKEVNVLNKKELKQVHLSVSFWRLFLKFGEIWFLEAIFLDQEEIQGIIENK
jgi:uncharacterized protein with WD repeat